MDNIIICSFYTDDDYYRQKKLDLTNTLSDLGINNDIRLLSIPENMNWSDVCRKKISFLSEMCHTHSDKKVFWIDVDCNISYLPDFIANFSSDIIGFARGFSSPMKVGYHLRSRFWEPCFLGINNTKMGRKFIEDARRLEQAFTQSATDDYFFEESWRLNCDELSYQVIPAHLRVGISDDSGFFNFGASGNVEQFKGKVVQHTKIHANQYGVINDVVRSALTKLGLYTVVRRVYLSLRRRFSELFSGDSGASDIFLSISKKRYKMLLLAAAMNNDKSRVAELEKANVGFLLEDKDNLIKQAVAILEYRNYADSNSPLSLCWWFNPEPGNMGDWLSPYILSRVSQRGVQLISPSKMSKLESSNIVCVGSIAKFANDNSVVIGSGVSRADTELNPNAKYLSLRGPRTGQVLKTCGGNDPGIYGDPAIVMPRLYPKSRNHKYNGQSVLVRHFSHQDIDLSLPDGMDELSIMASTSNDIEFFIDELHHYDYVVTSAMHCYILCQAYGIPSALVVFETGEFAVAGDGMKYLDYAEGVGVEALPPISVPKNLSDYDFSKIVSDVKISDEKIDTTYDFLKMYLEEQ